jgi:SPP1 family phage portal protein
MIQINNLTEIEAKDISWLLGKIKPELDKRKNLYERYKRKTDNWQEVYNLKTSNGDTQISFEKYIADISSGYFGGKAPKYDVEVVQNEDKLNVLIDMFNKVSPDENYKDEMDVIIKYISDANDDGSEHYELTKDYLIKTGCYERIYENEDNEIVYAKLDALQTAAIYDYSTPVKLIGLVRYWEETSLEGDITMMVEITDINGTRFYSGQGNDFKTAEFKENTEERQDNNWDEVPAIAMEQPEGLAVFENVVGLITMFEQVIQNEANTFKYNDEAKLKVIGYKPENPLLIDDGDGNMILNPDRELEDRKVLEAKVLYFESEPGQSGGGDAAWIEKNINDTANMNFKKTTLELITMLSGVPNMSDIGFTNADNASAIDRKFFSLEQMITTMVKQFESAYMKRWKLIFGRINLKKNSNYDFRDIQVKLYRNLPTDKKTETDRALSLRGLLSEETIIGMLPDEIDPKSELEKREKEDLAAKEEMMNSLKEQGLNEEDEFEVNDSSEIEETEEVEE